MAFKKKGKVTKKKAKKSGGKRDEWSHEGGLVLDGKDAENEEDGGKKRRRTTQDREESIRRSKLKNNDRKRKQDFKKKMSKRVKFGEVAAAMDHDSDSEEADVEPESAPPREVRLNPLPVLDRLQLFLAKSLQQRKTVSADDESSENESGSGSGDESADSNSDAEDAQSDLDSAVDDLMNDDSAVVDQDVADDAASMDDSDEEGGDAQRSSSKGDIYYDRMFNTSEAPRAEEEEGKLKHLCHVEGSDLDLYGKLPYDQLPTAPGPYRSVTQLPGLHKLFRGGPACARIDPKTFPGVNSALLPYLASYADAFLEGRDHGHDAQLLQGMLVHAVSHTVKARAKVVRHNQKLKKKLQNSLVAAAVSKEAAKSAKKKHSAVAAALASAEASNADDTEAMRDQGFCRPRLLILCPFRSTALRIVQAMRDILGENTSVSGWDKLVDEFAAPEVSDQKGPDAHKPEDWKALFENQNMDDDFKMGIQLNPGHGKGSGAAKGVYMRLFSDFFISDIILASPIGLRLAIGAPVKGKPEKSSEGKKNGGKTELSPDFLSSVEMVLLPQADVMFMQNWEHVEYVLRHTNQLPTSAHDTDYSRARQYFLEGQAAAHRQLMLSSGFNEPELQAFFRAHAKSLSGQVRLKKDWAKGQLANVISGAKQVFQLVPGVRDFDSQEEARFRYFKENVLAPVLRLEQKHTLIVTPSYLHYIRVRNELLSQEVSAAFVCEYSRESEISRGRSRFFHGTKDILLYSGRAHFFRRFHMRGAKHVIFYSLPEYAHFYTELVNMLSTQTGEKQGSIGDETGVSCLVLYSPYERMALERIVGAKRCAQMLAGAKATFMFC